MQMKFLFSRCLPVVALLLFVTGCTKQWFLSVENSPENRPVFCFSMQSNCAGDAVQFASIVISEVDPAGNITGVVWSIQGASNQSEDYQVKKLTYGVVPTGWREDVVPQQLRVGVSYTAMGNFFFRLSSAGKYEVLSREQFFAKLKKKE